MSARLLCGALTLAIAALTVGHMLAGRTLIAGIGWACVVGGCVLTGAGWDQR